MKNNNKIEINGIIITVLPNTMFKVKLENNKVIIGYISGKIRKNYIKILTGDKVLVEISPYDINKGRIIYRYK